MLKRFKIQDGTLIETESDDGAVYFYVNPDKEEREALKLTYNINEHTLTSALDPDEVSRIEFAPEHTLLICKRPRNYSREDNFFFNVGSMGLLLKEDRLVVVSVEDFPLIQTGFGHSHQIRSVVDLTLTLLHDTVYHFLGHLKAISMVARQLEQKIIGSTENKYLIQMFNLSESLIYYINAINGNNVVLGKLRNYAEKSGFSQEAIEHLDDVMVDNNQCYEQAKTYSTVFAGLMDARGNLVNNNMNVLLKKLTIINVVFLPLNLIAGIGGMSEFTMMTHRVNWKISYSVFCVVMVVLGWLTAYVLRKVDFGGNPTSRRKRTKRR